MQIEFSPFVLKELKRIKRRDGKLAGKIVKQLSIFKLNQKHPSLRLHKLTSKKDVLSVSITISIRMLYKMIDGDTAYFFDIGTHDEVYKNN